MLEQIRGLLKDKQITDIISVGFIDIDEYKDGIGKFHLVMDWIYLEFNSVLLELVCFNNDVKLSLRFTDEVTYQSMYEEEDFLFTKSSIINIVLSDSDYLGNDIKQWVFYNLERNAEYLTCDALRLTLANGAVLFIDPFYMHGMRIGGRKQEECWYKNLTDGQALNVDVISYW